MNTRLPPELESGGEEFSISYGYRADCTVRLDDIERCLLLIRNIGAIKAKISAFSDSLEGVR